MDVLEIWLPAGVGCGFKGRGTRQSGLARFSRLKSIGVFFPADVLRIW